ASTPPLRTQRAAQRARRRLHLRERWGERLPGAAPPAHATHPVERVEEHPVAGEQGIEGREPAGRHPAIVHARGKRLRPLGRVGALRHALRREPSVHDEIPSLARLLEQHRRVHLRLMSGRPPKAARQEQRKRKHHLDPIAGDAYDSAFRPRMSSVAQLPSIYFEKLLESSTDIVVAVDRKGIIGFYNDGARQTLGYSPDEVLGQHVPRLY